MIRALAHSKYLRPSFCSLKYSTISSQSIAGIESRWTKLPEAEQGALADKLHELQQGDWKKMTLDEQRAGLLFNAAYYIAYGQYGPRAPKDRVISYKVAMWTGGFLVLTLGVWTWWQSQGM